MLVMSLIASLFTAIVILLMATGKKRAMLAVIAAALVIVAVAAANAQVAYGKMAHVETYVADGVQHVLYDVDGHVYEEEADEDDIFGEYMFVLLADNGTSSPLDDEVIDRDKHLDMIQVVDETGHLIMLVDSVDEIPAEYIVTEVTTYHTAVERKWNETTSGAVRAGR